MVSRKVLVPSSRKVGNASASISSIDRALFSPDRDASQLTQRGFQQLGKPRGQNGFCRGFHLAERPPAQVADGRALFLGPVGAVWGAAFTLDEVVVLNPAGGL